MSDTATLAQIAAARPDASTWVGANAGSGKTRVLTNRVARLLLHGTDPRRILCLTFTKAAAGEMQNRLFETLGTWAMLPDEELAKQLSELGETGLSPERLERARTLFASALETPGGLKIQTIHAFSEALLRRFPLEAGVPPRFDVLDDRGAAQLRMGIVEEMAADPGSGFAALAPYIGRYGTNPDELFRDVARMRMRFPKDQGGLAAALNLGAPPPPPLEAFGEVERLIEVLSAGGKTAAKLRDALLNLRAETGDLAAVEKALITGNWTVKANICTDDMVEAHPDAPDLCEALADAIRATREHEKAERAHASAAALGHVATEFLDRLDRAKQIAGALEFDDLIRRAAALLKDPGQDWIRYRLDGGTHHVLVDEAQDTSPEQWAIVDALTSEFFAGEGATEGPRTVFVVGDEKQSIYSFQGADPDAFEEQRARYRDSLEAVGTALEDAALLHSFRSAPVILRLVDEIFRADGKAPHLAHKADLPGRVEMLPFIEKDEGEDGPPWYSAEDHQPSAKTALSVAEAVCDRVAEILGAPLPGRDTAVGPGDILILVQRRSLLFREINRGLKARRIAVAGVDRMKIGEELAVKDLLSLLRAVATEADDLSLAEALRSPVLGLSEADLFALAHGRKATLAAALKASGHVEAAEIVADLTRRADFARPFELLQRILVTHDGRRRIRARLGAEGEEAVDVLLDLALGYERAEVPTLTGFLDWMGSDDPEVKRELDGKSGEVRVMTVHGAKGLEAPVVILPDTVRPKPPNPPPLLKLGSNHAALAGTTADRPAALAAEEDIRKCLARQERRRLLYVALTRAERWLIIAGGGKEPDDDWWGDIKSAAAALGATRRETGQLVLEERWTGSAPPPKPPEEPAEALPAWAREKPPAARSAEVLVPSQLTAAGAARHSASQRAASGIDAETARLRGLNLHLLLEHLPSEPPLLQRLRGSALLERRAVSGAEADALLDEALGLIDAPALRWIFAADGISEVPIRGQVAALGGREIDGIADRVVRHDGQLWVIDFKSDAVPVDPMPPAYGAQVAAYVLALGEACGEAIKGGILWTRTGKFAPLPHGDVTALAARVRNH